MDDHLAWPNPDDLDPVDDWLKTENLELRDQLEVLEVDLQCMKDDMVRAINKEHDTAKLYRQGQTRWEKKHMDENHELVRKTMLLSNLCDEYEVLLDQYVSSTGTKLTNNRIEQIKQQGGF